MINIQMSRNSYIETVVKNTTNSLDLLIMLYDGAIDYLNRAKKAILEKDLPNKVDNIFRLTRIIEELLSSLDKTVGGEIAERLEELYIFCFQEISKANLKNDIEYLNNVEKILCELRDAWRQIR